MLCTDHKNDLLKTMWMKPFQQKCQVQNKQDVIENSPTLNLYAFLALYFNQSESILGFIFENLLKMELNFPNDILTKFNISNYLFYFGKNQESVIYLQEL